MSIDLMPHNQRALDNAKKMFKSKNRVAIIHPTGTGKGRIARKLMEENQDKKIIYFSPSLAINEQLEIDLAKYGISKRNIRIMTYQKLMKMTPAEIKRLKSEYIILDEFHHCGAKEWGKVVNELLKNNEDAKVLGLSATPIRYTNSGIRDMAEEIFDNNIASEMSLEAAIAEGILNEPTYVTGLYEYEEMVKDLEKRISECDGEGKTSVKKEMAEKELARVKKYLEKAISSLPDLLEHSMPNKSGKYIVFCSSIEDMKNKIKAAPELFKKVNPNIDIMQVSSDDEDYKKNSAVIQKFSEDKNPDTLKLLFCVNMLNEGFHLEDIDGGIMMRVTASPTLYTQQLGRIISAGKKKDVVLIDLVNNIDEIETIIRFYQNLSKAKVRKNEKQKIKGFKITEEIRNIRDIIAKIHRLTSRRANTIEANVANKLNVSFDTVKWLIDRYDSLLVEGRENGYDGEDVLDEYKTLNLFSQYRKAKLKFSNEMEIGGSEYIKRENEMMKYREELIVGHMGLTKWMLKTIPELTSMNISEEDKEQIAMKYLIQAVDSYNPSLRTQRNTAIRFDQYLLAFVRFGIEREHLEYDSTSFKFELLKIKEKLEECYGKDNVSMQVMAEEIYARVADGIERGDEVLFQTNPFLDSIKAIVEKERKKELVREKKYKAYLLKDNRITPQEVESGVDREVYGIANEDVDETLPYRDRRTFPYKRFDSAYVKIIHAIRNEMDYIYRRSRNIESLEEVMDFDIDSYELDDGDSLDIASEGYISDGVYLEIGEPNLMTDVSESAYTEEESVHDMLDLKRNISEILDVMTPKKAHFLEKVAGLNGEGGEELSQREWGKRLGISGSAVSLRYKQSLREFAARGKYRYIRNFWEDEYTNVPLDNRKNRRRANGVHTIRQLKTFQDIATGDFDSIYLSQILENEELFNILNSSGFSNLGEIIGMTESELKEALEGAEEYVEEVKDFLAKYRLELREEEEPVQENSEDTQTPNKAEFVKLLVTVNKAQTEEINRLETELENSKGREDN